MTVHDLITRLGERQWVQQAACRDADPQTFFPHPSGAGIVADVLERYCNHCTVRTECAEWATTFREYGIWGDGSETRRRKRVGLHRSGIIPPARQCTWCARWFTPRHTQRHCTKACAAAAHQHSKNESARNRDQDAAT